MKTCMKKFLIVLFIKVASAVHFTVAVDGRNKEDFIIKLSPPRRRLTQLSKLMSCLNLHRNVKYDALWQMNLMNGFLIVCPSEERGARM